ncbi:hypothetical protein H6P81_014600 [Aristolochia fimbriata]|uniref:Uncharacterized protein n=1 Tax=Aristolochia fimbriata TaxID=158543 RepID=A0AAV7E559_ARIFI|nr:hypothetical protein H6P81_014600 [Aristolochia fimbriata]
MIYSSREAAPATREKLGPKRESRASRRLTDAVTRVGTLLSLGSPAVRQWSTTQEASQPPRRFGGCRHRPHFCKQFWICQGRGPHPEEYACMEEQDYIKRMGPMGSGTGVVAVVYAPPV